MPLKLKEGPPSKLICYSDWFYRLIVNLLPYRHTIFLRRAWTKLFGFFEKPLLHCWITWLGYLPTPHPLGMCVSLKLGECEYCHHGRNQIRGNLSKLLQQIEKEN